MRLENPLCWWKRLNGYLEFKELKVEHHRFLERWCIPQKKGWLIMKFNIWAHSELMCDLIFSGMTDMEISEKYRHLLPTPEEVAVIRKELDEEMEIGD